MCIRDSYEADTETDKVAPHFSSCYGSFCTFYLYGVLLHHVWRSNHLNNLTVKEFNLHWCKSNFREPVEHNLFSISSSNSWSPVRNIYIPLLATFHSNLLQVPSEILRIAYPLYLGYRSNRGSLHRGSAMWSFSQRKGWFEFSEIRDSSDCLNRMSFETHACSRQSFHRHNLV